VIVAVCVTVVVLMAIAVVVAVMRRMIVPIVMGMPATADVAVFFYRGLIVVTPMPITVRMPASVPIGLGPLMGVGVRMLTCDGDGYVMIMRILRNPLPVGVRARFTVLVTVRFGGAGVRHGGFLARFVV
jgi:hypothetical protein